MIENRTINFVFEDVRLFSIMSNSRNVGAGYYIFPKKQYTIQTAGTPIVDLLIRKILRLMKNDVLHLVWRI